MFAARVVLAVGVLSLTVGCQKSSSPPAKPRPPAGSHVRFVTPPVMEDVAGVVAAQLKQSAAANRRVLVYVGAGWCEPCQRFHHAAESGQLDEEFGDVDFLAFDADADAERLLYAGYESQFIPLLVVPGPDGRATAQRMEGSVKGEGSLGDMVPRLRTLLGR